MFGLLTAFDGQVECAELLLGSATFLCHPVVNSAPNSVNAVGRAFSFRPSHRRFFLYSAPILVLCPERRPPTLSNPKRTTCACRPIQFLLEVYDDRARPSRPPGVGESRHHGDVRIGREGRSHH